MRVTLAVPEIRCSLFTSPNFDRCAVSHSLNHPPDAVVFNAADSATLAYLLPFFRMLVYYTTPE